MSVNPKFIVFVLIICCCQNIFAQDKPKQKDTAKVYRNIEKYSKKRKFTKFLHKLIFEPVARQKIKKNTFHKIKKQDYTQTDGKIIRNIVITTLDPFEYSETDTTKKPTTYVAKAGNSLHMKTRRLAIQNLLLLKKNKPLDSLLAKESERLIRKQRYIRGARITTKLVAENSDSVDVYIRVLDAWSLVPDFSVSTSKSTFDLTEKNFLGTGHTFSNTYVKSLSDSRNGYSTSYTIPNILNTFITTSIGYKLDLDHHYSKYVNVARPFFSPYTRWGAGVYLDQQYVRQTILDPVPDPELPNVNVKFTSQDYWAGHAFPIFKGNTENDRVTNLITSLRYYNKTYVERPDALQDELGIFTSENLYLAGIGISSRKFTQDKYIFNYNTVEDVGTGFIYNITSGYQKKNDIYRFYFGARFAAGKYFSFGYLSSNIEYGTFFKYGQATQSAINFSSVYFTNLYESGTGRWKFRQFIKPQVILGMNRLDSNYDRLSLNESSGLQGFNEENLLGTKKILLTLQTQGYSPWRVLGFRLNPFLSCTMGMLGQKNIGFSKSQLYSQLSAGIIVSNDYLVFDAFQFSFSYYPNLPDSGSLISTNSVRTYDFGLQDFELSKPLMVPYQ